MGVIVCFFRFKVGVADCDGLFPFLGSLFVICRGGSLKPAAYDVLEVKVPEAVHCRYLRSESVLECLVVHVAKSG